MYSISSIGWAFIFRANTNNRQIIIVNLIITGFSLKQ
jgi:hypothetical protein